ncbi:tRNA (adenosine(37)-N6)-threonylcarbamoyltransferase complex ATPase subunit type 1 TsaE [Aliihoeflea sp. 40Bstr573]|uniref:tRNA (adenosine(37)-N6)-threonylcarbamoyltransferase complex ATPase subunit type 1 TsaE n=1 Tax=Aliihoeflea sp. 40Bstr573 TaxID=2696467 RepID=UPI002094D67F|nr:tRNA (adenosine(37)-N6)-threonylcarbamoyltransferase complex ATPase subunit type 1 TsaE [Aliihoeflea sp. 40Bstr573]MCO6386905.1 tRNA (adenosine(37)-N6)-threonylcarbamoyltransferase complex ATPase subunit type 1 TsaE [Aliihoeflea sp. 40Bstr573]
MIDRLLADEAATRQAGNDIAAALRQGDAVALHGDLGAGKTTLARAIIRSLAADADLEVPSPTFTLVQTYSGRLPVAHFDLYRIGDADEMQELGLDEALADGAALVEWPDKAGVYLPETTIHVKLLEDGLGRRMTIDGPEAAIARFERTFVIREFLDKADRQGAVRGYLAGDASARSYETVDRNGAYEILMNAPRQPDGPPIRDGKPYSQIAHLAESVLPFVAIGEALRANGLCAPEIRATDLDAGLLLIEDLGRDIVLDADGKPIAERYHAAADVLATLHERQWPASAPLASGEAYVVPAYDRGAMAIETELLIDWYLPFAAGRPATEAERRAFQAAWQALFDRLETAEKSLVLRDFHSPNIIWREEEAGTGRVGIIDFQDALIGPAAYDVASLAMDARVTISEVLEADIVNAYVEARGAAFDRAGFDEAYAIMAAQRNSKIIGIFVRLDRRDGKPHYLKHLPRIRDYLERATRHEALAELRALYRSMKVLPEGSV